MENKRKLFFRIVPPKQKTDYSNKKINIVNVRDAAGAERGVFDYKTSAEQPELLFFCGDALSSPESEPLSDEPESVP